MDQRRHPAPLAQARRAEEVPLVQVRRPDQGAKISTDYLAAARDRGWRAAATTPEEVDDPGVDVAVGADVGVAVAVGARKRFSPKAVLAELAAVRYPCVTVQVVDLDEELAPLPEFIVAVPTYVFEGRVIWLGNPSPEELFARLGEAAG
jgi:hypothetical protein